MNTPALPGGFKVGDLVVYAERCCGATMIEHCGTAVVLGPYQPNSDDDDEDVERQRQTVLSIQWQESGVIDGEKCHFYLEHFDVEKHGVNCWKRKARALAKQMKALDDEISRITKQRNDLQWELYAVRDEYAPEFPAYQEFLEIVNKETP